MRPFFLALLTAATAVYAQQPLTEKIDVSVVNVDVTVTANGKPIRGLTRDDFEIFEDGRRQTITNFYVAEKNVEPPPATTATPSAPMQPPAEPRFRKRVLVLVDIFHTTKHRRAMALGNLERMIDDSFRTGEYDWSIALMASGVTMILPLTSDKAAVHRLFDIMVKAGERTAQSPAPDLRRPAGMPNMTPEFKLPSQPSSGVDMTALVDTAMSFDDRERIMRARITTHAITDAVRGFASTPGKKIVLLLTGDIGLNDLELTPDNHTGVFMTRPLGADLAFRGREITDLRDGLIQEANASGVTLYIFNVEGLETADQLGVAPPPATNTSAIYWIASETGGRVLTGNDGAVALEKFDAASSNYYSLGYRSSHGDDGKPHRIEVRLGNGVHAKLDYRTSYTSSPTATRVERAMESPIAAALLPAGLPVRLETGTPQPDKQGVAVPVSVNVPFSALQFLPDQKGTAARVRVYISVFTDMGKKLYSGNFPLTLRFASGSVDPKGMMVYKNRVIVRKSSTDQIVAVVRDETTDALGGVAVMVKNPE